MHKRTLALIAGLGLAAAACKDSPSVTDLNNVSAEALASGLTRASTSLLVTGLLNSTRGDYDVRFLVFTQTMGRDFYRLENAEMFATLEPCVMCAGAMVNTRLGRLVFGCADPRCGAAGSVLTLTDQPGMLHTVPVTGGVLAEACLGLIQDFFRRRRGEARAAE